ncbi:MAG TPA: histidine kinase [Pseudonocardiaceae bacterium]
MTSDDEHGRGRGSTIVAFAGFGLAVGEITVGLIGALVLGLSFASVRDSFVLTNSVIGLSCAIAGVLISWQRPRNPVGWLLLLAGIFQAGSAAAAPFQAPGVQLGVPEPVLRASGTIAAYSWPWSIALCLPLALLLFPDGHLPGLWRRVVAGVLVAETVLFAAEVGGDPAAFPGQPLRWLVIPNYAGLSWLWTISELVNGVVYLACLASLVVRYWRGEERLRRQLLWLALALFVMLVMFAVWVPAVESGPLVLILLVIPLVPAAITIAVLRYQLLDIRLVVSRALLYALLTIGVVSSYLGLVAVADLVLRREIGLGTSVLATLVIALGFNPVRVRLQRVVDHAFYGDRADPVRAVSRLGERLGSSPQADPADGLAVVRDALRLPYAALLTNGVERAAHGTPPELLETVPLDYRGERVGELVVGVRSGQRRLSVADCRVLELLAAPLAVAVHATALSEAVARSRESIVAAREEERRRLRRDLHDGLGPVLTGVAFQADAARNLIRADPVRADALLGELRGRTAEAIEDIRRLVYELRPPSLDELGLVAALRRQAEQLGSNGTKVSVVAPLELPALPAAVEVAAYRIAVEALTNAVRHAGASNVELRMVVNGALEIAVTDDGAPTPQWRPGVGLTSMRERAAELRGTLQAGPEARGGRVLARLPL